MRSHDTNRTLGSYMTLYTDSFHVLSRFSGTGYLFMIHIWYYKNNMYNVGHAFTSMVLNFGLQHVCHK